MAQRGRTHQAELIVGIFQAFFESPTWPQAELARKLDVRTERLRETLENLVATDRWPLERQFDPPNTFWSVPAGCFPGGVLIASEKVPSLLRVLKRAPRSAARDVLIRMIARAASAGVDEDEYVATPTSDLEDTYLPALEAAIRQRTAVKIRYFSANRGHMDERHISPHRIASGPPARVAATCHVNDDLRWFRVDRLQHAEADPTEAARSADPDAVDRFVHESIDGFAEGSQPIRCSFVVRDPDARWVKPNLPLPMTTTAVEGGFRFTTDTRGVRQLARFVTGLGGAARAETPELAALVEDLASGALHTPPAKRLPERGAEGVTVRPRALDVRQGDGAVRWQPVGDVRASDGGGALGDTVANDGARVRESPRLPATPAPKRPRKPAPKPRKVARARG